MSWETSCHCGTVSVRLAKAPEEIAECNCSLCFSHGILWAYYSSRDVAIEGETRTYNRADRPNPNSDLHFCATCGCSTHWSATWSPCKPGPRVDGSTGMSRSTDYRITRINCGDCGRFAARVAAVSCRGDLHPVARVTGGNGRCG